MNHAKRNWKEYNKSLVNNGSLTVWIDPNAYAQWIYKSGKRGRPKFSSYAIKVGWILKTVYRLVFRALQGFFNSILQLMKF